MTRIDARNPRMPTSQPAETPQARPALVEKMGGDARASTIPCPMLSVLVMEDLIKPDANGNVKIPELKKALASVGLSSLQRFLLAHGGASAVEGNARSTTINLFKLMGCSLDHKGSLGPLQNGGFNPALLDRLLRCSSDGKTLTLSDLSTAQALRMEEDGGGGRDKAIGRAEIAALLLVFGKPNAAGEKAISVSDLTTVFKDNRLPQGWEKPKVSTFSLVWNMARMAFQQSTSAAGRSQLGLQKALSQATPLDASGMRGLSAMCPAGMRPKGGVGINEQEVASLHSKVGANAEG